MNATALRVLEPVRSFTRQRNFTRAFKRFCGNPKAAAEGSGALFDDLIDAWGNAGWSGQPEFLRECVLQALDCHGPVLECGSGLTTLLVGTVSDLVGVPMWTLEHMPEWAARVQKQLDALKIKSVRLTCSPLLAYDGFDWYAPPLDDMPGIFALVICDGPPAQTRGGRYGLGRVMKCHFARDCTILLDDAERIAEQEVAARWASELNKNFERRGADKPYFLIR